MDFSEAKLRQLDAAATYRVYGHELALDDGKASARAKARRRWRFIHPCFCVHDSPESPCPCMEDEPRWWLPGDAILREGDGGRKDHHGQELQFFDVLVDATIMVESVQPVSVRALKALGSDVSPDAIVDLTARAAGIATMAKPVGSPDLSWHNILETIIESAVSDLLKPIDWQGAAEKWKESQGKPPS
jgi:hypothetical protein